MVSHHGRPHQSGALVPLDESTTTQRSHPQSVALLGAALGGVA